jgi:hypothetical protein
MSLAGGLTVAYVFAHIFPHLAELQTRWLELRPDRPIPWFEHQIYVAALLGLLLAYGTDHLVHETAGPQYWVRVSSFAIYNVVMGYYVADIHDPVGLALAVVALGAHFLVTDRGLDREGGERYQRSGRLILAAAVLIGGCLGLTVRLPEPALAAVFALLAGGIILHALNEEIPSERHGRFGYFALGAVSYTVLVLGTMAALH